MLKPMHYLLLAPLALSSTLFSFEEEELEEGAYIADLSQYPTVAERTHDFEPTPKHHYVLIGEMLYVKPSLDSLPWLYEYDNSNTVVPASSPSATSSSQSGRLKLVDLPYDFGLRIAAGFNATWMNMHILASWDRLHTSHNTSVPPLPYVNFSAAGIGQPVTYYSYWNPGLTQPTGQVYFANNHTRFHWDQIDLTGKFPLRALKRLTLSPLIGVRGIISNFQTKTTFYTTEYGVTDTLTPPFNENITTVKQRYRAIGVLGGLDSDFDIGWGLHLSTLLDGALVFGNVHSSNNSQMIVPAIPGVQVPLAVKTKTSGNQLKPILDAQVTLSWNYSFWKDKVTFNMHVGYEAHYLPNFFEFIYFTDDSVSYEMSGNHDLTVQGLDVGLGFSF